MQHAAGAILELQQQMAVVLAAHHCSWLPMEAEVKKHGVGQVVGETKQGRWGARIWRGMLSGGLGRVDLSGSNFCQDFIPIPFASPWNSSEIYTSKIAGVDLRRPIREAGAYLEVME